MVESQVKKVKKAKNSKLVEKMMKAADTDNAGEVDIAEFKVIMRAGPEKKESEQGRAGFCGFFLEVVRISRPCRCAGSTVE